MRLYAIGVATLAAFAWLALMAWGGQPSRDGGTISILAASSLRAPIEELADRFSAERGVDVRIEYLPSNLIEQRIASGAPAHLIAVADSVHAMRLRRDGLIGRPRTVAANAIVLATAPGNPAQIESFSDLTETLKLGIGQATVPVGRYARRLLTRLAQRFESNYAQSVLTNVVTESVSARDLVWPLRQGEVDAALIYRSDAVGAGSEIGIIEPPEGTAPRVAYQVATVESARSGPATEFASMLSSPRAADVFTGHGFSYAPISELVR